MVLALLSPVLAGYTGVAEPSRQTAPASRDIVLSLPWHDVGLDIGLEVSIIVKLIHHHQTRFFQRGEQRTTRPTITPNAPGVLASRYRSVHLPKGAIAPPRPGRGNGSGSVASSAGSRRSQAPAPPPVFLIADVSVDCLQINLRPSRASHPMQYIRAHELPVCCPLNPSRITCQAAVGRWLEGAASTARIPILPGGHSRSLPSSSHQSQLFQCFTIAGYRRFPHTARQLLLVLVGPEDVQDRQPAFPGCRTTPGELLSLGHRRPQPNIAVRTCLGLTRRGGRASKVCTIPRWISPRIEALQYARRKAVSNCRPRKGHAPSNTFSKAPSAWGRR